MKFEIRKIACLSLDFGGLYRIAPLLLWQFTEFWGVLSLIGSIIITFKPWPPPLYKPRNAAATGGTEPITISDLARTIDFWPVFFGILAAHSGPQRRAPSKKQVIHLFHPSFLLPGLIWLIACLSSAPLFVWTECRPRFSPAPFPPIKVRRSRTVSALFP